MTISDPKVKQFTLKNKNGVIIKFLNYGGVVTEISTPDKNGLVERITLGFNSLKEYKNHSPYFGATLGRFGNRIAKGKFSLEGKDYSLFINNGPNSLHGGQQGFDKHIFEVTKIDNGYELNRISPDGEEGYPGTLNLKVTFELTDQNEFKISYKATTDKTTVFSPSHHSYFNLSGNAKETVLAHNLQLNCDRYLPTDETMIPNAGVQPVSKAFDFQSKKSLGKDIFSTDPQIHLAHGYDHTLVVRDFDGSLTLIGRLSHPDNGRSMAVYSTEPGVQLYTGNHLGNIPIPEASGAEFEAYLGVCLETQHFPDSPNQPDFPSTVLKAGEQFESHTVYHFSW